LDSRVLEPELLDELPATALEAIRSRRDLRRLNAWMRHAQVFGPALQRFASTHRICRIVELGAGDGTLSLQIARALAPRISGVELLLVDRQKIVDDATLAQFHALGWTAIPVAADVFDWLERGEKSDVILANLFLHHFDDAELRNIFIPASRRTKLFLACEPRRSTLPLLISRVLWLIGCNSVTRHDAVLSVRAGFAGRELSDAWPDKNNWRLRETALGLFSHHFAAEQAES
jgi:hypothetical protein